MGGGAVGRSPVGGGGVRSSPSRARSAVISPASERRRCSVVPASFAAVTYFSVCSLTTVAAASTSGGSSPCSRATSNDTHIVTPSATVCSTVTGGRLPGLSGAGTSGMSAIRCDAFAVWTTCRGAWTSTAPPANGFSVVSAEVRRSAALPAASESVQPGSAALLWIRGAGWKLGPTVIAGAWLSVVSPVYVSFSEVRRLPPSPACASTASSLACERSTSAEIVRTASVPPTADVVSWRTRVMLSRTICGR